jgi:hypothetical protein
MDVMGAPAIFGSTRLSPVWQRIFMGNSKMLG